MNISWLSIQNYAVTSTKSGVIYFGGEIWGPYNRVVEFKNFEWTLLGTLVSPRQYHHSIKIGSKIYIFGGEDVT